MSNLTPVVRPDVNGKMVTRHVRGTQAPTAVSALAIPRIQKQGLVAASGATIEAAKGRRALLGSVTTAIPQSEVQFQRHARSEIAELVRELPDSTVELFHAVNAGIEDGMEKVFLSRLVIRALDCGTDNTDIESAIYYYGQSSSNQRDIIDEFFETGAKKLAVYPIGNLICAAKSYSLEGFSFDPELPLGKQDERTVQQCNALKKLHYVAEMAERWEHGPQKLFADDETLLDTRLAQMVVDAPEIADEVTDIMYERETVDCELISSILGSHSSAIREGTL
jgi:hypothetical protein